MRHFWTRPTTPGRASARLLALGIMLAALGGCSTVGDPRTPPVGQSLAPVRIESDGLEIRLTDALTADAAGALAQDPGWLEYRLEIENRGPVPVTIRNVKLLTPQGRYLDSAADYGALAEPPDVATEVAGQVALTGAGIAAGQVIPFGGNIVGIVSGAASAASAQGQAAARREFLLRRLKDVELAPGGRVSGSAFLPRVERPKALVVDWVRNDKQGRIELPLAGYPPE